MQRETLLLVLADVRALVASSENDFSRSSWAEAEAASRELDGLAHRVGAGELPSALCAIFLPTGPLQELALASGWGDEFLALADRFDAASSGEGECSCLTPPFPFDGFESRRVGVDASGGRFAEVDLVRCRACGQHFVHYFYELEGFSRSGRWYRAPLSGGEARALTTENARTMLAKARLHFYGGSYFESSGQRGAGALDSDRL